MIQVIASSAGRTVSSFPLDHGVDPEAFLAARGWRPWAVTVEGRSPDLTLRYSVEPGPAGAIPVVQPVVEPSFQRIAAYVVVIADGTLLLTEGNWPVPGRPHWLLPGGGVDPGEEIGDAVVRETWEETGQRIEQVQLVRVSTTRRIGDAPGKRLARDFHAVRLLHRATCPAPTEPVVHDVGGSTASARWVPIDRLDEYDLLPWIRPAVGHLL